jgi:amino acid permease
MRYAYLLILAVTVALTWETNVNQIIAYASRAFALYYVLQCVVAFVVARQQKDLSHRGMRLAMFAFLAAMCLLVFILGVPSG